jgi:hypothetical protein
LGPDKINLTILSSLKLSTLIITKNSVILFFNCSARFFNVAGVLQVVPSFLNFSPIIIADCLENLRISFNQLAFKLLIPVIIKQ